MAFVFAMVGSVAFTQASSSEPPPAFLFFFFILFPVILLSSFLQLGLSGFYLAHIIKKQNRFRCLEDHIRNWGVLYAIHCHAILLLRIYLA